MRITKPEDMSAAFAQLVNAGDLDALIDLYDANVKYVARSGAVAVRDVFRWVAGFKDTMDVKNEYCVVANDIALVRATWKLNGVAVDGRRLDASGDSAEVLRRDVDGTWRYLIDHPYGGEARAA